MTQFQSEIEFRVKVIDKELRDLERRAAKIQNPFSASGASKGVRSIKQAASVLQVEKNRLQLQQRINVGAIKELNTRTSWVKALRQGRDIQKDLVRLTEREAKAAQKARNQRIGGAVSGAAISAAFPLITGGGATESVLGGIGGLAGSAFGPLGAFAGGILGTAIGQAITEAEGLNRQLVSLNAQFGETGSAAVLAADDLDQLARQLNVTEEDVISLAGELSAIAEASAIGDLAKAFGPVGGAKTAEAVAEAGKDEAAALRAIDSLRGQIGIKTAEELTNVLKIEGSQAAQAALLDALLEKAAKITDETAKQVGFWDRIAAAIFTAASGQVITPESLAGERAEDIVGPDENVVDNALQNLENYYKERDRLEKKYNPKTERSSNRDTERAAREEARVQATLARLRTRELKLETQLEQVGETKLDQTKIELDRLNELIDLRKAEIVLSTEDERIKLAKLSNLDRELLLEREKLLLQEQSLKDPGKNRPY